MTDAINKAVTARPAPPLRPLVADYVGYRMEGYEPGVHRGLPGRGLTLVLTLDAPLVVTAPGASAPGAHDATVGGLHASPALIHHDGTQIGIQLDLAPLGARTLLGLPASALAGAVVGLDDLIGPDAAELVDRVRSAPDWATRFAAVDTALLAAAARHDRAADAVPAEVARAYRRLRVEGGNVAVADLAEEVGWSRRHLTERFRAELGLAPKLYGRVLRFERARRRLQGADRPGLAAVAAEAGYYDQAHLTRDFNELAGCPPTRLLAEELPSVQDAAPPAGAG